MVWQFTLVGGLSAIIILHIVVSLDRWAGLSGLFLVLLSLCMESLNQWLGPFWIAQNSTYLILSGLPVEKLILYCLGGTFACLLFKRYKLVKWATIPSQRLIIVAIAFSMVTLEFFLNQTEAYRWVRPWTAGGAFIYYLVGAFLLLRFYEASPRTKIGTCSALILVAFTLMGIASWNLNPVSNQGFCAASRRDLERTHRSG